MAIAKDDIAMVLSLFHSFSLGKRGITFLAKLRELSLRQPFGKLGEYGFMVSILVSCISSKEMTRRLKDERNGTFSITLSVPNTSVEVGNFHIINLISIIS